MKKVIPIDTRLDALNSKAGNKPSSTAASAGTAADAAPITINTEQQLYLAQRLVGSSSVHELLTRYFAWVSEIGLADGLNYLSEEPAEIANFGEKRHHSAQYELTLNGEPLGEVRFSRRKRFSEEELANLEQSLGLFSRCLKTAREIGQLRALATHDPLTGLFNRGALDTWMETELRRARRHKSPLVAMMIDIDHFKSLNDNLGHLVGDKILRGMAGVFRRGTRGSDLLFRFGGDEFAILLPHTDVKGAESVARLIRSSLAKLSDSELGLNDKTASKRPDVSIGIAAFKEGDDQDSLLRRADTHLYHAKALGRGRTCSSL
ncbi:MAG: GGDEF domain-containing protein [Pseudomonadota bacterium]